MTSRGRVGERWLRLCSGWARVGVVFGLLLIGALWMAARSAEAAVGEALRGFGAELARWSEGRTHSAPRRIFLNGLELRLVTASSTLDVRDVLDHFHEQCRLRGGFSVPEPFTTQLPYGIDTTLRQEADTEGVLACIDTGRPLSLSEAVERLRAFAETGHLDRLGELRYVLARRTGDETTVILLWTEGAVPLFDLFPKEADAPGKDPEGIERPRRSRRLLSAAEEGLPYSVTLYELTREAELWEVTDWYRQSLEQRGWAVRSSDEQGNLLAEREGRTVAVRMSRTAAGNVLVTVAELS